MHSPLPEEQVFKLHFRCRSCWRDSFPRITLGVRRLDPQAAEGLLRQRIADMAFECSGCGFEGAVLVAHQRIRSAA
jgi:ribosomal protein L37E